MGLPITASAIFPALTVLNNLRQSINTLPSFFSNLVEGQTLLQRIQTFLLARNLDGEQGEDIAEEEDDDEQENTHKKYTSHNKYIKLDGKERDAYSSEGTNLLSTNYELEIPDSLTPPLSSQNSQSNSDLLSHTEEIRLLRPQDEYLREKARKMLDTVALKGSAISGRSIGMLEMHNPAETLVAFMKEGAQNDIGIQKTSSTPSEASDEAAQWADAAIAMHDATFAWSDSNELHVNPKEQIALVRKGKKEDDRHAIKNAHLKVEVQKHEQMYTNSKSDNSKSSDSDLAAPFLPQTSSLLPDGPLLSSSTPRAAISHLTFSLPRNSHTLLIGPVGCGKSSVLSALLGELLCQHGRGFVRGQVGYVAQTPWLLNASVRDNITFGEPWDEQRYAAVLRACALDTELPLLPAGDRTEVGERGITLSGGQRARVALARCCYSRCSVCLLDDPIAAVDAHVGQHLVVECIHRFLHGRTVLMASHHTKFMTLFDHVIELAPDGTLVALGPPSQFKDKVDEKGDILLDRPKAVRASSEPTDSSSADSPFALSTAQTSTLSPNTPFNTQPPPYTIHAAV